MFLFIIHTFICQLSTYLSQIVEFTVSGAFVNVVTVWEQGLMGPASAVVVTIIFADLKLYLVQYFL